MPSFNSLSSGMYTVNTISLQSARKNGEQAEVCFSSSLEKMFTGTVKIKNIPKDKPACNTLRGDNSYLPHTALQSSTVIEAEPYDDESEFAMRFVGQRKTGQQINGRDIFKNQFSTLFTMNAKGEPDYIDAKGEPLYVKIDFTNKASAKVK